MENQPKLRGPHPTECQTLKEWLVSIPDGIQVTVHKLDNSEIYLEYKHELKHEFYFVE